MKKKLLSVLLAGAMVCGMSTVVFADDTEVDTAGDTYSSTLSVTGTTNTPTIKITAPTTGSVVVNPYKLKCTLGEQQVSDQIVSATQYIVNESNVPIKVDVTVSATTAGNAALATAAPTEKITTNSVFMYLQVVTEGVNVTVEGGNVSEKSGGTFTEYSAKSTDAVVLASGKSTTKSGIATLGAATYTDDTLTDATGCAFRFGGSAATNPTKAWTSNDTVSPTVVFSFVPQVVATE